MGIPFRMVAASSVKKASALGAGADENVLPARFVRHIDEAMLRAAGDAHHGTPSSWSAVRPSRTNSALDDAKDLSLAVAMMRRAGAGRVDRLDEGEHSPAGGGRHADKKIEPDDGDLDRRFRATGMQERNVHWRNLSTLELNF